jgi:hypothetical protein
MPTSKEYRHRAEECLRLANETTELFAQMALLEMAAEFRAKAQQLELLELRESRRRQRFSPIAIEKGDLRFVIEAAN